MSHIIPLRPTAAENPSDPSGRHDAPAIRTDAVCVVYTSMDDTPAAVRVAGDFAKTLHVPVTVIHFRIVPYALPVDEPGGMSPAETGEFSARLRTEGLDVRVRVILCRDERRAIPTAFAPHSLVVVAGRRSWWPTEAARWRRLLESAGHFVVFVDRPDHSTRSQDEGRECPRAAKEERSHA